MEQQTRRHSGARMLVIGLDGATFRVMQPLLDAGKLPTLARLIARGTSGVLTSIIPPQTGPAWPSMFTGKNPGKHGIFHFEQYDIRSYACYGGVVTSRAIAGQTLFDLLSNHGRRVAAIRVPMTYPAWKINGIMASGFPASGLTSSYVYPPELQERIPPMRMIRFHGNTPEGMFQHLEHEIGVVTRVSCDLLDQEYWDLFMLVYQQPDHAHHYFWRYMDPECSLYTPEDAAKYGHLMGACYERIDAGIARILEHVDEDTPIFIISDHGAERTPNTHFLTNRWLRSLGLLAGKRTELGATHRLYERRHMIPKDLRIKLQRFTFMRLPAGIQKRVRSFMMNNDQYDWRRTQAYRFPVYEQMEGIAINLKGRQPEGIVEPGAAYERLREAIIQELRRLRIPGTEQPLVAEVYRREEVYSGPYTECAPDIIFRLAADYEGAAESGLEGDLFGPVPPVARELHNAWHDREGIFIVAGPGVQEGQRVGGARLLDVAPTVLHMLGLPVPRDMDGRVLTEVLTEVGEQRSGEATGVGVAVSGGLSQAEEEDIKERLRNLGYM
jgi:predicted AlkP superfamily phosphohydrolase/phosphomutase